MKFLRNLLATVVGLFIFSFLSFFILVGIGASAGESEVVNVKNNSVLKLTLNAPITERGKKDPLEELGLPSSDKESIGLTEIKEALRNAKEDDRIDGVYLNLSMVQAGFATLHEIHEALRDFKESGKFVYSFSQILTEKSYYLAATSDSLFLNHQGFIEFNGLASNRTFYKGLFEKLGIKPRIFKVGTYKSAVEPFIVDKMSDASRHQTEVYLNSIYDFYLKNVAIDRNMEIDKLKEISNKMLVKSPGEAVSHGIADRVVYYDQVLESLKEATDRGEGEKVNFISLKKYLKASKVVKDPYSKNKIAVIVAEGTIISGKAQDGYISGDEIAKEIRKARQNDNIKAVVLRINSPGGSALASDVMWREVELTKKVKPIIASMSDVAASGGYYMAMACDKIVAQPNTITGSIGIFSTFFQVDGFFNDKLGITFDVVETGELSDIANPMNEFTQTEKDILQDMTNKGYENFTSKAAKGRGMKLEDLKKVAEGRVWTGADAKGIGLVDQLGGFKDAVAIAAEMAELGEDYQLKFYPKQKSFLEELLFDGETTLKTRMMKEELGVYYPMFKKMQELQSLQGVQARLPYDLEIN